MDKFGQALGAYRKHYGVDCIAFAITIVSQMAYYTSYYCAGASLHRSSALDAQSFGYSFYHAAREYLHGGA